MKINISLTINGSISKNSAIPAQTPNNTLFVDDFINFFNLIPPMLRHPFTSPLSALIIQ